MSRIQVEINEENREKLDALALRTGKTPDELVNEAVEELVGKSERHENQKFLAWREAAERVKGIWADREDLPDFEAIRGSMDRDVWGRGDV